MAAQLAWQALAPQTPGRGPRRATAEPAAMRRAPPARHRSCGSRQVLLASAPCVLGPRVGPVQQQACSAQSRQSMSIKTKRVLALLLRHSASAACGSSLQCTGSYSMSQQSCRGCLRWLAQCYGLVTARRGSCPAVYSATTYTACEGNNVPGRCKSDWQDLRQPLQPRKA